jgi:hypothetical protein
MARVPERVKRTIASFLATDAEVIENLAQPMDPLAVSAPQANAFDFQSGGVVEMLQKLEDKFKDERNELEKAEMEAKHAHEMVVQDLDGQIKAATRELGRQASAKAQRDQDAAEAKGDLTDTTATRDEDERYLNQLNAECGQKSTDFASRQQLRTEELEAIAKAIEILESGSVSGNAEKYLPNLVQTSKKVSFVYLRAATEKGPLVVPVQRGAANFLQSRAAELQSRILELVADKVAMDPFVKVRKMIKDLIVRLMEEASEEADHKSWCDTELTTNKQTRDTKTADVESLTSQRDELGADIGKLSQEIKDLAAAIAALDASVGEATKQRFAESASNKQTAEDAQEAQTAVAQALSVLKDFYDRAAEAIAFVQKPALGAPETFSAPYTGMGSESGGVIGMLEVIQSDFARLEAETESSEQEAGKAFDRFTAESAQDKAVKSTQLDHREKTRTKKKGDLQDTNKDLKATQGELDAALTYYDKLKPSCVDAGVSYSDRVQRRQQEIESLQEALRILDGEDIA